MILVLLVALMAATAQATELPLPEFRTVDLANGMRLYVAEDHSVSVVSMSLVIPHGGECDPPGKSGLADFTATACTNGIPGMDGQQVSMELQRLGATIGGWADLDRSYFSMTSLERSWEKALDLLARGIRTPTFPKRDVARQRAQRISDLQDARTQPSQIANFHANALLYDGRLGHPPDEESVRHLSRDDLIAFHRRYYQPNEAIVVTIGDFDAGRAIEALRKAFEDWPRGTPPPEPPPSPLRRDRARVHLVHKPGLTQATIRCVQPGLVTLDPEQPPFQIGLTALGGYFSSRLNTKLRIEGGKTYGARSWNDSQMHQGQIVIYTFTRSTELGAAIDTIRSVVDAFVESGLTAQELEMARRQKVGSYLVSLETPQQLTWGVTRAVAAGRTLEQYRREPSDFEAVTLEQANRAAATRLMPEQAVWVVVADKKAIGPAMERLGEYETVFHKEPLHPGNLVTRTRVGLGLTWNTAARGVRVSLLNRRLDLSGVYGFARSNDTWDYDAAGQATLDLHRSSSEYSAASLYLGATGSFVEGLRGVSPHAGVRLFPHGLGGHFSFSVEAGASFWDRNGLPAFYWAAGLDRFF